MKKGFLIIIVVALLLTGCTTGEKVGEYEDGKPIVYTSFYPLYFLADEIGKDNINLRVVIPNGVEPHDYEPSIKQLKDIENADVFIYNGAGFESWADKLINTVIGKEKALSASDGVDLNRIDGGLDPHIWLDPNNMNKIGEKIKDKFISLDEEHKEEYENNFKQLSQKLMKLDKDYREALKDKKKDKILVSHAAFGYMAKRYKFDQISIAGMSPEQEPSPKAMADIIDLAKENDFKYIFLETLASPKVVKVIADEANLEILTLNPIEGLTEEEQKNHEDYISIMEKNLENLKKELVN
jgi:zinc transport system substrate-binding protein